MKRYKKRWIILSVMIGALGLMSVPELLHQNTGMSESSGSVRNGKLKNGWLVPFHGPNFQYFSRFSYYLLDCGYVNDKVYRTILEAYKTCEKTCADQTFRLMECTRKHGGKMLLHWTHQNGTSVDFMVPIKKTNKRDVLSDHFGLFHYLMKFNDQGQFTLNHKTEIDFESMARHLLALDDACKHHGLRIRKIIFNTNLQQALFSTPAGQILQQREIFIPQHLSDLINNLHDDHYHVDFEIIGIE